ncbi:cell division protein DivIVA [Levilactobacillus namurensis]|nr:DivIVA domain-containing protein [Levilactobacillus namurensis]PTM23505.1 DivIVA domain-containing protein [Lactobacillus sp. PFC-70]MCW3778025.1 DivIVA domain-containing protein [Levilactobacillus namurensis]MDT7014770.1 DivIVA domain-containing protein [Levilactobacillus namurensis]MDT7018373.1 DivIVA domain-containing protein [Levilactobacillus namurensis]WNN64641.1 DivIVA domain-containing protein [Levilactobacillus namurensis]
MVLSPLDIHNKEFGTKMRGYNVDEVNDFLDQVIKDYQITLNHNKELEEQLDAANEKLKYFNDLKDSLNQSILVAQEAADKVKANSQKESEIIIREAQKQSSDIVSEATNKGNQIMNEASKRAKKLAVETDDLKKSTRVFRQRLQVMLESQLEVVKSNDWDSLLKEGSMSSYEEIKKVVGDRLDKAADQGVNSEAPQVDDAAAQVTETPVTDSGDASQETVVIFPDNDQEHYDKH